MIYMILTIHKEPLLFQVEKGYEYFPFSLATRNNQLYHLSLRLPLLFHFYVTEIFSLK